MRGRGIGFFGLVASFAFGLAACSSETVILVEIRSDLAVPAEVDRLQIVAMGASGARLDETFPLTTPFPHSYAIVAGADHDEAVTVDVLGWLGGTEVVRQRATTRFSSGATVTLAVALEAACVGVECDADEVCRDGECVAVGTDAGIPDAAVRDAAVGDAGAEAGTDAAVECPTECDDGVGCTTDECTGGVCVFAPDDGRCRAGETCTARGCEGGCGMGPMLGPNGGRRVLRLRPGEQAGSCGGGVGAEAYLRFDLGTEREVFISTHGSNVDTVMYLRETDCAGAEVACNDDADGLATSTIQRTLPAGDYLLVVDSKSPMSAMVSVDVNVAPPREAGDLCGEPLHLTGTVTGNTCALQSDIVGGCSGGPADAFDGQDAVYYFVVEGERRNIAFDTCAGCTDFEVTLEVRGFCMEPMTSATRIACSSGGCRSGCGAMGRPRQTRLAVDLDPGLYYLVVDGRGTECGNYEVRVSGL